MNNFGPLLSSNPLVTVQVRRPCRPIFNTSWFPYMLKSIIPVIFKHTVDTSHVTISWKIKRSFYKNFEKISAQSPVELVFADVKKILPAPPLPVKNDSPLNSR